jgi:gas vesicle protein
MDRNQFEQLGEELREMGHKRRQLAEKIFQEVQEGDNQTSKALYQDLSNISNQAIEVMLRQKEMFDSEVQRL